MHFTLATTTLHLFSGLVTQYLYILKCSVKLRSLHFVSPSEKYVSTSCVRNQTSYDQKQIIKRAEKLTV